MSAEAFRLSYSECRELLAARLAEPAPARIQLLSGPRQVGKTTLLLELADRLGKSAIYVAADSPEAALPGFWERIWFRAEEAAARGGAVVMVDEAHLLAREPLRPVRAHHAGALVRLLAGGGVRHHRSRGGRPLGPNRRLPRRLP